MNNCISKNDALPGSMEAMIDLNMDLSTLYLE